MYRLLFIFFFFIISIQTSPILLAEIRNSKSQSASEEPPQAKRYGGVLVKYNDKQFGTRAFVILPFDRIVGEHLFMIHPSDFPSIADLADKSKVIVEETGRTPYSYRIVGKGTPLMDVMVQNVDALNDGWLHYVNAKNPGTYEVLSFQDSIIRAEGKGKTEYEMKVFNPYSDSNAPQWSAGNIAITFEISLMDKLRNKEIPVGKEVFVFKNGTEVLKWLKNAKQNVNPSLQGFWIE